MRPKLTMLQKERTHSPASPALALVLLQLDMGKRRLQNKGKSFNILKIKLRKKCRFCMGTGSVTVELGGGEKEVSRCINCDGAGGLTCTTCQGSGIQPRYLDRREFKDDD